MPSCHFLPGISVPAMTSVEHEGLVWVWAGSGMPALKLSSLSAPPGECSGRQAGSTRAALAAAPPSRRARPTPRARRVPHGGGDRARRGRRRADGVDRNRGDFADGQPPPAGARGGPSHGCGGAGGRRAAPSACLPPGGRIGCLTPPDVGPLLVARAGVQGYL